MKLKTIIAKAIAAGLYLTGSLVGANEKDPVKISGSLNAGYTTEKVVITGKPQSEYPMTLLSGRVNAGDLGLTGGIDRDKNGAKEVYGRINCSRKIGLLDIEAALEEKVMPLEAANDKIMDLLDLRAGIKTRYGNASALFRERLPTTAFRGAEILTLGYSTPKMPIGRFAGVDINGGLAGTVCGDNNFIAPDSSRLPAYVKVEPSMGLKKGNLSLTFSGGVVYPTTDKLRQETYGTVALTYSFPGNKPAKK